MNTSKEENVTYSFMLEEKWAKQKGVEVDK
jgi:hypothetical protein